MDYILFIHKNSDRQATQEEWNACFELAQNSGLFRGGSAIGNRSQIGDKNVLDATASIGGFMRFEADDLSVLEKLLEQHPVRKHGGTLELCELPKT